MRNVWCVMQDDQYDFEYLIEFYDVVEYRRAIGSPLLLGIMHVIGIFFWDATHITIFFDIPTNFCWCIW